MNKNRHTPTPWHEGAGNGEGSIFASEGRMRMTNKGTTLWPICRMFTDWDEHEDAANAAFIVHACNAHDDLLAVTNYFDYASNPHNSYEGRSDEEYVTITVTVGAIRQARAALKGEQ